MGEGKQLIMLNHDSCPVDETAFKIKTEEVDIDLLKHNIIAWVYGHVHFDFVSEYNGVVNICTACPDCGGVDSTAAGIRKISIENSKLSTSVEYYRNEVEKADESVWSVNLGSNSDFSTPILYNGYVYAATIDDGYPKNCGISCVDSESGAIKWQFSTANGIRNDMAISDGILYAQDMDGYMYALDTESGKLLWKAMSELKRPRYTKMNVIVVDDVVIGGTPFLLSAYNKKTGELAWTFETEKRCEGSPAKLLFDAERRQLIINRHWRDLMIVDYDTKEIKLSYEDNMVRFRNETPLIAGDKLYCAGLWKLHTFDLNTCELVTVADAPSCMDVCGSPALDGDVLYYPTSTAGVVAVERETLKTIRKYPTGIAGVITPPYRVGSIQTVESTPMVDGDTLIFSSSDGCVYFYDKNTAELKKKVSFGAPILSQPILDNGCVIALDFNGKLTKIKL
jgi:outer membrane protein assembly factor BamB